MTAVRLPNRRCLVPAAQVPKRDPLPILRSLCAGVHVFGEFFGVMIGGFRGLESAICWCSSERQCDAGFRCRCVWNCVVTVW